MAYYSLVLVADAEVHRLKDPDLGKKLETAILKFSSGGGDGSLFVQNSKSTMKVVSSFNTNTSPRIIIVEGWSCYDVDKQNLPEHIKEFVKGKIKIL